MLIALVALMGIGARNLFATIPNEIRIKKFVAVNKQGREIVVIESKQLGGWMLIYS